MAQFDKTGSNLIFVISLPRSGSTMLQCILGGHPEILTLSEPWIMLHPLYALKREGISTEYEAPMARHALDDFLGHTKDGEGTYIEAIRSMASVLYGDVLQDSNKTFFLDKTPRYYFIIAELRRVFPKARFIFLLRNPLAALSSMLENWFNNQPEKFLKSYNRLDMVKGPELLLKGIRLLADDAIILSYEDLVSSPGVQVRKLCGRLGLEYYPEMLEYDSASMVKGRFGDRVGTPRHRAPVQESLEKWRANLTSNTELARFGREYLGMLGNELIGGLGYDCIELADALAD